MPVAPVRPAEVAIQPEAEEEETLPEVSETTVESSTDTLQSLADRIGLSLKDLFRRKQLDDKVRVGIILLQRQGAARPFLL